MLAVEVINIQTGVWELRDGRWCESRAWMFADVNDLVSCNVYASGAQTVARKALWSGPRSNFHWKENLTL